RAPGRLLRRAAGPDPAQGDGAARPVARPRGPVHRRRPGGRARRGALMSDGRMKPLSIVPAAQEDLPLAAPPLQPPVRLETHEGGIAHLVFEPPPGKVNILGSGVVSLLE